MAEEQTSKDAADPLPASVPFLHEFPIAQAYLCIDRGRLGEIAQVFESKYKVWKRSSIFVTEEDIHLVLEYGSILGAWIFVAPEHDAIFANYSHFVNQLPAHSDLFFALIQRMYDIQCNKHQFSIPQFINCITPDRSNSLFYNMMSYNYYDSGWNRFDLYTYLSGPELQNKYPSIRILIENALEIDKQNAMDVYINGVQKLADRVRELLAISSESSYTP